MRRAVALALALAAATAAVVLLLVAFDVRRWQERVAEDDVRFRVAPAARLWEAPAILPGDPARKLLGVADDVRYRKGVQAFAVSRPRLPSFQHPELDAARADAEVQLRQLADGERNAERGSEVVNLLGALATAVAPRQEQRRRRSSLDAAASYFAEAVRLDRANEDAKYNLESVLRRLQEEPRSFESPGGRLPRDEASMGGLRDAGTGY